MENDTSSKSATLEKKAVNAALEHKWKPAIETNLLLLDLNPNDKKARMRLGRAYLQTREFKKAEKLFRGVLKEDPVNTIAKRNIELAKAKKADKNNLEASPKQLIKEPGTTAIEIVELLHKNLTAEDFEVREELGIKINKASVNIYRKGKVIGKVITPDLVRRLNSAKSKRIQISVSFQNGKNNVIRVLFKSAIPVFKAERQELKPYMKKGATDEPEVEIPTTEEQKK